MPKIPFKLIIFITLFLCTHYSFGKDNISNVVDTTRTFEFKYKLTLKIDFKKREQILRSKNESPSTYDKALSFIKGDFEAAEVTDRVSFGSNKFKINSTISPTSLISIAIGDKKIIRNASGEISKEIKELTYSEKRGDSTFKSANHNTNTKKIIYTDNGSKIKDESFAGDMSDILSVIYQKIMLKNSKLEGIYNITNGQNIKKIQIEKGEIWIFNINNVKYSARKFTKKIQKNDTDNLSIWIDELTGIPLRYEIGLNDNYGATIVFDFISKREL